MLTISGRSVYDGIAIGKVSVFERKEIYVKRERTDDIAKEKERFERAKISATNELDEIYKKALDEVGSANAQIFEIHKMMIEDEDFNESVINIMETQNVIAEYAVAVTSDNLSSMFSLMDDSYMQARAADIKDISDRIIKNLTQAECEVKTDNENIIICADDLAPSETVALDKDKVVAFVTAYGSLNSHTAILARTMNIPAIIGVGSEFLSKIKDGEIAIVDGYNGKMYLSPDSETLEKMKKRQDADKKQKELLLDLKGKDNVTLDGTQVNIFANIGSLANIGAAITNDASGIGLFRSEFLYLENDDYPSEEFQFQTYKKVLESMAGKKVIIRTLDIGADKQANYFNIEKEENPALGFRAIRICLKRPQIFKTQLRALFRASVYGNLSIMFPMITSVNEVVQIKNIIDEVKSELKKQEISFNENIETGIMIETPAAAIISDLLAPMVDFFSIGTNDLTQYTLAMDRQNSNLDDFCDIHHEAIMRLIDTVTKNAHKHGIWVGICGELAGDVSLTESFLKMGVDELSVSPGLVLKLRDKVRKIRLK